MRRAKAFSTVNWRKYLDVKTNPRAKSFLKSRGDDVLWQISSNIYRAAVRKGLSEIVLLVHPNAGAVIRIHKSEYKELLNLCLKWFETREQYDRCSEIQFYISEVNRVQQKPKVLKKHKENIIWYIYSSKTKETISWKVHFFQLTL